MADKGEGEGRGEYWSAGSLSARVGCAWIVPCVGRMDGAGQAGAGESEIIGRERNMSAGCARLLDGVRGRWEGSVSQC